MKKILIVLCLLLSLPAMAQQGSQYTVSGTSIRYQDALNPELEVYLVNTPTVNISYVGMGSGSYQWHRYTTGAETVMVGEVTASLTNAVSDGGYFITVNGAKSKFVWIIDYTKLSNRVDFQSLSVSAADCDYVTLFSQMTAPVINYYNYNKPGIAYSVIRRYAVSYDTWDVATTQKTDTTIFNLTSSFIVPAPLQDTHFILYDQYADSLGVDIAVTSEEYAAIAVTAQASTAVVEESTPDNMVPDPDGLSAPVKITFTAIANDPVAASYIWYVYKTDVSTDNPLIRYTDKVLHYTFEESGTYQVKLEVSDRKSMCKDERPFEYKVSDFLLEVPNAFSPGTSPGSNDEFKVAYRSVVSFKAWIFNRWGKQLFYWTDPERGWDGKVSGKLVPPGVYFYVIEAKGSDGKIHTKKGDINILGGK